MIPHQCTQCARLNTGYCYDCCWVDGRITNFMPMGNKMENKVKPIDWTKPIRCTNHDPARVIESSLRGDFKHIVVISSTGRDHVAVVDHNGRTPDAIDPCIENTPVKVTRYMKVAELTEVGRSLRGATHFGTRLFLSEAALVVAESGVGRVVKVVWEE